MYNLLLFVVYNNSNENEGTKVHNPRRYMHVDNVHNIYTVSPSVYILDTYADKCVSLRGSIRNFSKDSALRVALACCLR